MLTCSLVSRVFRPNSPEYSRTNQETPSDQLGTPDVTIVDAAREVAKKANSEMSTVAAPIQSMASAVSGTDNPASLADWISSVIQTLEKLNGIVDKLATVSIFLCPVSLSILI